MSALRLRRALSLSSCIINHRKPLCSSVPALPAPPEFPLSSSQYPKLDLLNFPFQSRAFRASNVSLSSGSRTSYRDNNDDNKISPDEILFEGCDYNHWLITMDFPKDPKPSREEMVETYVQTAAKVFGSVEEAKRKIYACSTTTYNGFQVEVSEEMSEKFKGLPGVVFVLPDSYIDPVNKEYGGDKYINGTIIPRPPPISFARTSGRYGDRNRDFNRPRGPYQQGNSTFDNQGSTQGDARNFGAPQNPPPQQNYGPPRVGPPQQNYGPPRVGPPQQNCGPPRVGERRDPMPMGSSSVGWENYQGDRRDPLPSYQGNYSQGQRGNSYPQGQRDFPPVEQKNYADNRNYASPQGGGFGQGAGGNFGQGAGGNFGQGAGGNFGQGEGGNYGQGASRNYGQGAGGNYRQGAGGNYGQGAVGNYGQGVGGGFGQGLGGVPGQENGSHYRQSYSEHGENQRFQQGEQMNVQQGQQSNYAATGQSGTEHGRY